MREKQEKDIQFQTELFMRMAFSDGMRIAKATGLTERDIAMLETAISQENSRNFLSKIWYHFKDWDVKDESDEKSVKF